MSSQKYVFIHIPKTAGYSFWNACRTLFGEHGVTRHLDDAPIEREEADRIQLLPMIAGHISYTDVVRYFADRIRLTILREPVDRVLSQYCFLRTLADPAVPAVRLCRELTMEDYFALPNKVLCQTVWNRVTRQLAAHCLDPSVDLDSALEQAKRTLMSCSWVGFHENLELNLTGLSQRHPDLAALKLPRVRVTPERLATSEISPALRSRILDLNQYDIKLYEWACRHFAS